MLLFDIRHVYNAALGKLSRPVEALNVFHAMHQQMSTYPDLVAYHSIGVSLGQAGHMKQSTSIASEGSRFCKSRLGSNSFLKLMTDIFLAYVPCGTELF
ncbi:hypothetical protein P8452_43371 [Trifolium repens]|nr:hypothetical protein P8452_43371 [Trifolium repens]